MCSGLLLVFIRRNSTRRCKHILIKCPHSGLVQINTPSSKRCMMALQVKKATPLQAAPIMPPPLSRQARSSVVLLLALTFFLPCCYGARTTPLSSSQLASSAPHRRCRMRPYRLFRPRHQCNRSAKPAAEESRARRSPQSMAAPPQQRAAACASPTR